jgi:hypothetical protein
MKKLILFIKPIRSLPGNMKSYKNRSGHSNIAAFEIGQGSITVQFNNGWFYLYTVQSVGKANVIEMQRLATHGQGLNSFINRKIQKDYAKKWQ